MLRLKKSENIVRVSFIIQLWIYILFSFGNVVMPEFLRASPFSTSVFGWLMAVMYVGQFLVAPFWGYLSDIKGRYILFIAPLGYGAGQLMFALSHNNLFGLILSRFISGIFSILIMTQIVTFISDNCTRYNRTFYLRVAAMMSPLGTGISYLIGVLINTPFFRKILEKSFTILSYILPLHISAFLTKTYVSPFILQFIFGVLTAIFLYFFIRSNSRNQVLNKNKPKNFNIFKIILYQFKNLSDYKNTPIIICVAISLLNSIAYSAIQSVQYYLQDNRNLETAQIGQFVFFYSILSVICSLILQIFLKKFSNYTTLMITTSIALFISLIIYKMPLTILLISISISLVMQTYFSSTIQNVLVNYSPYTRGYLLGINQSCTSLGSIIGNFNLGIVYAYKPEIFNYSLQFLLMSIYLSISIFLIFTKLRLD